MKFCNICECIRLVFEDSFFVVKFTTFPFLLFCSGLRGNLLTGTLSPDMCQLTGLWYLYVLGYIFYIMFCCLPGVICLLILTSQVSYCFSDLRGNNLSGTIPDNIGNCTSFEILSVSFPCPYYVILKFFSYCFSMLTKLFFLNFRDISYNQITGEIPYNIGFLQVATLLVNFA